MIARHDCVLLSIHPEHAARIYRGEKRAELRKSFSSSARIVFLYETAPVSRVTGAFIVQEAIKASTADAIAIAGTAGVEPSRAETYFGKRASGWVIKILLASRIETPLTLAEIRARNPYFSVPQAFSYLARTEALTQELLWAFVQSTRSAIKLQPMAATKRDEFATMVRAEVGSAYEDIDDDFVSQLLDPAIGSRGAFSTKMKHVLDISWGGGSIGFAVLTEKKYGAWKSGPILLFPPFRGLGLGQALRIQISKFIARRGGISIYCTCSSARPTVVSYLLNSGLQFQARLRGHLARGRDELVFAERLGRPRSIERSIHPRASRPEGRMRVVRATIKNQHARLVLPYFLRQMSYWYFVPDTQMDASILHTLTLFDSSSTRYSEKARALYAILDSSGRPHAAALVTKKRSGMLKVNVVGTRNDLIAYKSLLKRIMSEAGIFRRIYATVPVKEEGMIMAFCEAGFSIEGLLTNPFGTNVDHVCFGWLNPNTSKSLSGLVAPSRGKDSQPLPVQGTLF